MLDHLLLEGQIMKSTWQKDKAVRWHIEIEKQLCMQIYFLELKDWNMDLIISAKIAPQPWLVASFGAGCVLNAWGWLG